MLATNALVAERNEHMKKLLPVLVLASTFLALSAEASEVKLSKDLTCAMGEWGEGGSIRLGLSNKTGSQEGKSFRAAVLDQGDLVTVALYDSVRSAGPTLEVALALQTTEQRTTQEGKSFLAVAAQVKSGTMLSPKLAKAVCYQAAE